MWPLNKWQAKQWWHPSELASPRHWRKEAATRLHNLGLALLLGGSITISGYFAVTTSQAVAELRELAALDLTPQTSIPEPTATPTNTTATLPLAGPLEPTATPTSTPAVPTPEPTPEPPTPEPEAPPEPEPTAAPAPPRPQATATPRPPAPTATPKPAPPPPPPAAAVAMSDMEQQLLALHNQQRAAAGLPPYRVDATLTSVARARATDMATANYFSHTSPTGVTAFSLLSSTGVAYSIAGENIARNNYPTDQSVSTAMTGFMNSPGHRANILDTQFTRVGIAIVIGADNMKYYAVVFADR